MIPVSTDYRQQLIAGNRNYVIKINMTLKDNTALVLTNEHIWDNGIVLDEAISSDTSLDLGAAIVGSLQVIINNITGNFSQYDFYDARLVLWMGVEGDLDSGVQRYYRMGFFVVDSPSYNGSLITLNCLDNMTWFDTPFSGITGITYPANAGTIIQKICDKVGVTLGTPTFPNYASTVTRTLAAPEQELNCREVLQYIAQKCCCYCKINTAGQLVLAWYDKTAITGLTDYDGGTYNTHTTPYSDGCDLDGGWFHYGGDNADGGTFIQLRDRAFISNNFEIEVSTDDIIVTGCRVRNNTTTDDDKAYDELWVDSTLELTHDRYILIIDNNPFIDKTQAAGVANLVGNILAGLPVRGFTATSLSDMSYETGDMATVIDFRGNRYYTWITHFTLTTNNSENFSCGVESVRKRSEQRFSGTVKTLAEANANAEDILDAYDNAVKAMDTLAANAVGYNEYYYPNEGTAPTSRVTYRYNGTTIDTTNPANPKFPNSSVVFKISGDGVFVSTTKDSSGYQIWTNGYDANSGTAILNLLYAQGLNARWITAGQISADRLTANVITSINNATGSTTISGGKINIAGVVNGINSGTTTIDGGKITANSMNADRISGGTIDANVINVTNIKAGNIASGNISADRMSANVVSAVNLSSSNISADRMSANVVSAVNASLGTIDTNRLSVSGIVGGINAGSTTIDGGKITANTVDTNQIKAGAVTANEIDVSNLKAVSTTIGPWTIDDAGFTNGTNAWVTPTDISCGKYGATLIGMRGKNTGSNGFLEVAVNAGSDWVHVFYNSIQREGAGSDRYVKWWDGSDERLKEDIQPLTLEEALKIVLNTEALTFRYKRGNKIKHYGVTAQRMIAECEELDLENPYVHYNEMKDDLMNVDYEQFIMPLMRVVQSQQKEIDLLKREIAELKERVK